MPQTNGAREPTRREPARVRRGSGAVLREVWVIYSRELRAALRERMIVVNSILVPTFLYPFLMWVAFTGVTFVEGQTEGFVSRVVVVQEWPQSHPQLRRELEGDERLQLRVLPRSSETRTLIGRGDLDALLEFRQASAEADALPGNYQARIIYNRSKERSLGAKERLETALRRYRDDWLRSEATARGIVPAEWQVFTITSRNEASGKQMGAFLMGLMLPLFFVIMLAIGCFYPAVDATAGERERNTWETLMSTAASRGSIVTAKYLYVATFGFAAGVLNLTAMLATMKPIVAPLLARTGEDLEFGVPLVVAPLLALAAMLLAGFVAAAMMILASFARTFKEGQSMVTPFFLLILLPALFANVPGLELSPALAMVPMVNVLMVVREAIAGVFHPLQIGITFASCLVLIALCLRLARFILSFEDVVTGSYAGSLGRFIQERVLKRRRAVSRAREVAP